MNGAFNSPGDISSGVAEQAVSWLVEMQEGPLDPHRQHAWEHWLQAHSEHQRAWEHIQRINQRLRGLSSPLAHAALNAPQSRNRRQALEAWRVSLSHLTTTEEIEAFISACNEIVGGKVG